MKSLKLFVFGFVMLISCKSMSQSSSPSTTKLFFEKVFLHTDRVNYAAGDDLWFKAYLVNGQDGHPISTSRNLYVELIAPADTIMSREIIRIDNGSGKGDFKLADSIPAGRYRVRAYTNWMRNFGDYFVFEKQINVYSNLNISANHKAGSAKAAPSASAAASGEMNAPVSIRFYPEGGSLVEGLSSIVAVKATGASGRGAIIKNGAIISSAGDTVARFNCDSTGMGLFALLPVAGQSYTALARVDGNRVIAPLTRPLVAGLTLSLRKADTSCTVTVRCNPALAQQIAQQTLTLSAAHAGKTYIRKKFQLNDNLAQMVIPNSMMPEGITVITLFDGQGKPNCERLVYVEHPGAQQLEVKLNRAAYQSREKVTVDVFTTDAQHKPVSADLSLAATDAALAGNDESNIKSYFLLQSELKGRIEHPSVYFDPGNANRARQLDILMLTQGWREFVWRRLADSALRISYIPEQGISLSGKVRKVLINEPVPNANITLSAPKARGNRLFIAETNAQGKYYFDNLQLYGDQNVRLSSKDVKGKADGWIQLDSIYAHQLEVTKSGSNNYTAGLPGNAGANLVKRALQSRQRSLTDTIINLKEVKVRTGKTLQLRDQTVVSFGYPTEVLTPTAQDMKYKTLRDYILFASKQARTDVASNRIVFLADGKQFAPRIIVDNSEVPFTDDDPDDVRDHYYNDYYDLPIDQVIRVEIKKMLAPSRLNQASLSSSSGNAYGSSMSRMSTVSGMQPIFIISLTLKPGAFKKKEFDVVQADVKGYYEAREFYAPVHEQPDLSPRADNRVTVYWQPEVRTDANGHATVSFYNADPKTTVKINVQGVSTGGSPLYKTTTYQVK